MAKRFIDTGLFDDSWFSELKADSKMFWIYYVTKCDHAGLLKFNKKLIEFQTGIKTLDTVIQEIGDRLVRVNEQLFFCPKFIQFQYPDFPKSNVKQQASAIDLLIKNGLWDSENHCFKELEKSKVTVTQDLTKSHDNVNDNVNGLNKTKSEKKSLPFDSPEFVRAWDDWLKYRSQIKKPYRSELSKLMILNRLGTHSESEAVEMIRQSISNSWQGIFDVSGKDNSPPWKNGSESKKLSSEELAKL